MIGFSGRMFSTGAARGKNGAALGACLAAASFSLLVLGFALPAPALDASGARAPDASAPLPMFKNPRAALRAGLESYHAGDAASSI